MEYDFNILHYLDIYKRLWKKMVLFMGLSMFLIMVLSLLMPVAYVSTVTFLLPTGSGASSVSSLGKILGFSGLLDNTSSDAIMAILKSGRMSKDISEQFSLNKNPRFTYGLDIRWITGGLAVDVKGSDSALVQKIANFSIQNLDKINSELNITPNKPMVKVLDWAGYGSRRPKQIPRKMLIAGIGAFLLASLYAFFLDFLKKLKSRQSPQC